MVASPGKPGEAFCAIVAPRSSRDYPARETVDVMRECGNDTVRITGSSRPGASRLPPTNTGRAAGDPVRQATLFGTIAV